MPDLASARERMIERHIAGRGLTDPLLLQAFRDVPRELFVSAKEAPFAYDDGPLPIEAEQTISQPYIVALMISLARVRPGHRVLEVGAGSGYAAAIIARIAAAVVAFERHAELARLAADRLRRLDQGNVRIIHGDGSRGAPEEAPFDAIIVSAAAPGVPAALLNQLSPGAALVMPVGLPNDVQRLVRVTRTGDEAFEREELGQVRFVPLIAGETDTGASDDGGKGR